ncbi:hypothetical protein LYNGBM3L_16790 [Moorena producens 3L]|uniref:Uncharacterized protein n=1 Tax=Moorena producens 3L TaxID=489825 RepID=F4XLY0_9CYAN|nr:hypothetical protein LYNGBM3L_16790 [Moorena producens 3L]
MELLLKSFVAGNKGFMGGIKYPLKKDLWNRGLLSPIPIGQSKIGVATEFAAGFLKPTKIASVPGQEPPVAVGAIEDMNKGVAVPVSRIGGRQLQHCFDCFFITLQGC